MHNIEEFLDKLGDAKIFTTLDATSGYYQIVLSKNCQVKQVLLNTEKDTCGYSSEQSTY